jgi:DNA-binding MarR family transcriptional regulator
VAESRKSGLVDEVVAEYRKAFNLDNAFDAVAADVLRLNTTDLHCINIIQISGGITAGDLATRAGLTTGAVTGVIDRLERAGYARRVPDPSDRRRVRVEVTPHFHDNADEIWGPVHADWQATLTRRFTADQLGHALAFLQVVNAMSAAHLDRLRGG